MSTTRVEPQRLESLNNCGIKLDSSGRIVDWADRPAQNARCFDMDQSKDTVIRRKPFTAQEDWSIREWCQAAEKEGVRGTAVFEQLECLYPKHTWQAYEGRWRKILRSQTVTPTDFDAPFPGLDADSSLDNDFLPDQNLTVAGDEVGVNYADQRVETARVLLEKLELVDEAELLRLLRTPGIVRAYIELVDSALSMRYAADKRAIKNTGILPRAAFGRSRHDWKVNRVMDLFQTFEQHSHYRQLSPDKSSWTDDYHDVHFMLCIVTDGVQEGRYWSHLYRDRGLRVVCERAQWLLLWFRWLWKPSTGTSAEATRLLAKKREWLSRLDEHISSLELGGATTATLPTVEDESSQQEQSGQAVEDEVSRQEQPGTAVEDEHMRPEQPSGTTPADPTEALTPDFWLCEEIRQLYINNRDRRLASWGVTATHRGTCVLVPADWAYSEPTSLMEGPSSWPRDESECARLALSLGPSRPAWARAVAWFESWPRSRQDLLEFLDTNGTLPQGSHLCHHGLCIVPAHIIYEAKETNLSRNSCSHQARVLRMYQAQVPVHCLKHDPPCLMQSATLTPFEAFAIQFFVLRQAKKLPSGPLVEKPAEHPRFYRTFESYLPTQEQLSSISIDPTQLVATSSPLYDQCSARYRRHCRFCVHPRVWGKLTSYWSHLRVDHVGEPRSDVLNEVTAAAEAYEQWAHRKFYSLERSNAATWEKIVQAKQPGFSWEMFSGWRLHKNRLYKGRQEQG